MNKLDTQALQLFLQTPKTIVVIPHRNPDGDAIGSTLGWAHFLRHSGHQVQVISPNDFPDFLGWLPGSSDILCYEKNRAHGHDLIVKADLVCTLDFNAFHRVGIMEESLKEVKAPFLMIDHHQEPGNYAQFLFSNTQYGSTCEMVFDVIESLGQKQHVNQVIATCLYTGIMTDSGSFRFPSTTARTHRVVAELIEAGAPNSLIHQQIYDSSSFHRLQLLGCALSNLKIFPNKNTAYTTLSQAEMSRFKAEKGDTEGFVNYGLSIKGIHLAAIFIENQEEGIIKISFRSKGDVDVNQLSRAHFDGGGHINAAGGRSKTSLAETVALFEQILNLKP
ncbi:MAG: DHH family phosphoesterase [Flavobacterium sp. BFFFF2]|nr:MAG: DHH family phosphoesterase [Flavobacterium sp. BFFFF2]